MIDVVGILLTALLWGGTNPFIRIASKNISTVKDDSKPKKIYNEFFHLITNWKYIIPFSLNQCGSVAYVFMLQKSELSFVVPITNSLTLMFTALVGWILGEDRPNKVTLIGMLFVILGTTICWLDKSS